MKKLSIYHALCFFLKVWISVKCDSDSAEHTKSLVNAMQDFHVAPECSRTLWALNYSDKVNGEV